MTIYSINYAEISFGIIVTLAWFVSNRAPLALQVEEDLKCLSRSY
jgi:hypothetical protein